MKIVVAITGASGIIYSKLLLENLVKLKKQIKEIALIFSKNAKDVCLQEMGEDVFNKFNFPIYKNDNFFVPFASGSSVYDAFVICPCSMGTLGRIASGISNDLITRTADVILKERKKLILITREMPLNLIQIENMRKITLSGGIICPASPSFYSKAKTIDDLAFTVVDRIIDLIGLENKTFRW